MSTPSWIRLSEAHPEANHLRVTISVWKWHPGYWRYIYCAARDGGCGRLTAVRVVLGMLKHPTTRNLP